MKGRKQEAGKQRGENRATSSSAKRRQHPPKAQISPFSLPPSLFPFSPSRLILFFSLLALLSGEGFAAPAARNVKQAAPTASEVSEKQDDLKELRGQIESLRKEVAAAEGQRASAADQLKGVEQEISVTQRDLHKLSTQKSRLQETMTDLGRQADELERQLGSQQAQLEKLIYRQYLQGSPDALQLILNGDDPNQTARDLHYLSIIGKARSQMVREIGATLQRKQALAATTRERADELAGVEAKQKEQHGKLLAQREQRKVVLQKIAAKISEQRREIGNLQRDEKRLSQLIERLSRIIAARSAPRREAKAPVAGKGSTPEISNESTPGVTTGSFAQLKGSLRLPVRGVVSNRFGAARQEGSNWKGLFIRAGAGSEVKAIAAGRVVFADWMRGFGNLMIVDHGGSYLSIYGNNDALLKQVGDSLRGGETIASVGNSGGNPESGLYFELRQNGQPIDPLKWVKL